MGPGLLVKSILQGCFSLMVFGWAQIVMDIQPLLVMLTGKGHLHGFSHTYTGATLLAVLAAVTGKYLSETGLRLLRIPGHEHTRISWAVVFTSAFIGTYSHVAIDSIMHSDIAPYYPLSAKSHLYGITTAETLHKLCFYSGLLGLVLYFSINRLMTGPGHRTVPGILSFRRSIRHGSKRRQEDN